MILVRCTVPMQGIAYGEVVTVDETDPQIKGYLKASALVPIVPPKPRKRHAKQA